MELSNEQKVNILYFAMDIARLSARGGSAKISPDEALQDTFECVCALCENNDLDIFKDIPCRD